MSRWMVFIVRSGLALVVGAAMLSCDSAAVAPVPALGLDFSIAELNLGSDRVGTVSVVNTGSNAVGPVELSPGRVRDQAGNVIPGSSLLVTPTALSTLNPGASASVVLSVDVDGSVQAGTYTSELVARVIGELEIDLPVSFQVDAPPTTEIQDLTIRTTASSLRQGTVLQMTAEGTLAGGGSTSDIAVRWSVEPAGAGFIDAAGRLVGYGAGALVVRAEYGGHSVSHGVSVSARGLSGSVTRTGEGAVGDRFTSDLWVHGTHAYTGTWGRRVSGASSKEGNQLNTWDVSDVAAPRLLGSVTVNARTVNDVKVRSDGTLAILTHEGSNDGLNGITLLDLSDPAHPGQITRYTDGLTSGIHNVWIEGDYAYLVLDGTGNGLRVLDISDPATPVEVASFYAGSSFLHDVYVRDGLAFLSHWGAGLVILDVGHGVKGGSPTNPVEVSRLSNLGGETHNAWYWPYAGYVFVGEEDFTTPGIMRVLDVRNLEEPEVVATYRVPGGTTPHNFWLDEGSGTLYLAWYENGLRALDVTGDLLGELERQGREIFGERYAGAGGCTSGTGTCTWAPQVHDGRVFVSDMNHGIVVLTPGS